MLLVTLALPLVLPALATSLIATAVAWIALHNVRTCRIPSYAVSGSQIVWAALIGPLAGLAAVAWVRLIARVHDLRPSGRGRLLAPIVVLTMLGVISIAYPQLLGNGKDAVQLAATGALAAGTLAALVVLKPIVTAALPRKRRPWRPVHADADLRCAARRAARRRLDAHLAGGECRQLRTDRRRRGTCRCDAGAARRGCPRDRARTPQRHPDGSPAARRHRATIIARRLGAPSIYSARLGEQPTDGTDRAANIEPPGYAQPSDVLQEDGVPEGSDSTPTPGGSDPSRAAHR